MRKKEEKEEKDKENQPKALALYLPLHSELSATTEIELQCWRKLNEIMITLWI